MIDSYTTNVCLNREPPIADQPRCRALQSQMLRYTCPFIILRFAFTIGSHLQLQQLVLQELEVVGVAHHQLHLSPLPVTEARVQTAKVALIVEDLELQWSWSRGAKKARRYQRTKPTIVTIAMCPTLSSSCQLYRTSFPPGGSRRAGHHHMSGQRCGLRLQSTLANASGQIKATLHPQIAPNMQGNVERRSCNSILQELHEYIPFEFDHGTYPKQGDLGDLGDQIDDHYNLKHLAFSSCLSLTCSSPHNLHLSDANWI